MFRTHVFRGAKFPQVLHLAGKESFGVLTDERAGMLLRVTSLERTLVDVLDRPDLSGSWEEIWRSLESVEFFDLDKVVEYALLLGNSTTGAKVGFFLEQHREPLMVEDRHLKALHDLRPRQPHYLDRVKRISGHLVSKWNLVVPRDVLERAWGEVL
jgi:predicted transcriptional regulator of viral defense system